MPTFAGGAAVLLVLLVLAYLVRVVGVALTGRRHPSFARALARWWVCLPVVVLVGLVTWALGPVGLLLGAFAVVAVALLSDTFGLPQR